MTKHVWRVLQALILASLSGTMLCNVAHARANRSLRAAKADPVTRAQGWAARHARV